jgi:hypothetical protein
MYAHARRFAAALLLLAVAACAGTARQQGRTSAPDPSDRTTVRVENQAWAEATIYVMHLSQRIRLGDVPAQGTRTFTLPEDIVGAANTLRFIADPVGSSQTASSFDLQVFRGQELHMTIPPQAFR